jgi:recombinational DNA repair ATPase RecF
MALPISKIALHHFRGASQPVDLAFDKTKPLIMIFGENGTGKSTLIDAIDLISNECVGSLDGKSSATVKQHGPTIGRKPADVSIQIVSGAQQWRGSLSGSKVAITGPTPRPRVHMLRRGQLVKLTEAQPAQR